MEKVTFEKWDASEIIETREDVMAFLGGALEEKDIEFLLKTIGDIARSKGMVQIAKELGITRAGLYRSLSTKGNPSFATVVKVLDILGMQIKVEQKDAPYIS